MREDPIPPRCTGGKRACSIGIDRTESAEGHGLERVGNPVIEEGQDGNGYLDGGADRPETRVGRPDVPNGITREKQVDDDVGSDLVNRPKGDC